MSHLPALPDGVYGMVPPEAMTPSARKLRDTYACKPGLPLFRREFGFYCLERWAEQGMPQNIPLEELFHYDAPGNHYLSELGWCEAAFAPQYEEKVLEDRGEYELAQDFAGRGVLYFKGRRSGFMPEYVDHPVKDMRTWQDNVKWRMDPTTPARWENLDVRMQTARERAAQGLMIGQSLVGGYMYLRSLIGPVELLYMFNDHPEVIEDCMQTWFTLADATIARHQQHVTLDEIFLAEDICYNHGCLISPRMMKRFLFPYYQQLITNAKRRQLDPARHLYIQVDTDGLASSVIPLYQEAIGMDVMSPFEVASGCDVVEIARQYPGLVMFGGIDKRVLAGSRADIDAHLERILPFMRARGGYIPTCDHGVPEEVSLDNYHYYRQRCLELGG